MFIVQYMLYYSLWQLRGEKVHPTTTYRLSAKQYGTPAKTVPPTCYTPEMFTLPSLEAPGAGEGRNHKDSHLQDVGIYQILRCCSLVGHSQTSVI